MPIYVEETFRVIRNLHQEGVHDPSGGAERPESPGRSGTAGMCWKPEKSPLRPKPGPRRQSPGQEGLPGRKLKEECLKCLKCAKVPKVIKFNRSIAMKKKTRPVKVMEKPKVKNPRSA